MRLARDHPQTQQWLESQLPVNKRTFDRVLIPQWEAETERGVRNIYNSYPAEIDRVLSEMVGHIDWYKSQEKAKKPTATSQSARLSSGSSCPGSYPRFSSGSSCPGSYKAEGSSKAGSKSASKSGKADGSQSSSTQAQWDSSSAQGGDYDSLSYYPGYAPGYPIEPHGSRGWF
jgi:hypothetical protein